MNKRKAAIFLELVPVLSAVLFFVLIGASPDTDLARKLITAFMLPALLGFAFFLAGRKLAGEDRAVRILGILDLLATASVIGLYILAAISFGL